MASSKVDLSLDEIVTLGRRRGRGRGRGGGLPSSRFAVAGKPWAVGTGGARKPGFQTAKPAATGAAGTSGKAGVDLRDMLATRQKKQVGDLRAKLKPKFAPAPRGRARPMQRGRAATAPGNFAPRRDRSRSPPWKAPAPPPAAQVASPPPVRRHRELPVHLPSSAEAKKITVTVPGLSRPVSEVSLG